MLLARRFFLGLALLATARLALAAPLAEEFAREVVLRLEVPPAAQAEYTARLEAALARAGLPPSAAQYFVLVDRSPRVQAAFDRHGLLDADYEAAALAGRRLWVLRADRVPTLFPGRYLVVVDSERRARPSWARRPSP